MTLLAFKTLAWRGTPPSRTMAKRLAVGDGFDIKPTERYPRNGKNQKKGSYHRYLCVHKQHVNIINNNNNNINNVEEKESDKMEGGREGRWVGDRGGKGGYIRVGGIL